MYFCEFCERRFESKLKNCTSCNKGKVLKFKSINKGTIVRISKKALDEFYLKDEHLDMYYIGPVELGNIDFNDFYSEYRFFQGLDAGVVIGHGASDIHVKVKYFDALGEWRHAYVRCDNLEEV